jgi:phosphoglycolate phosphatase-like HAD superfamily hydrolase
MFRIRTFILKIMIKYLAVVIILATLECKPQQQINSDDSSVPLEESSLPSWNEGAVKQAILNFVAEVTDKTNPNYVPPAERIAVFDNDGTLWSEQPLYFQFSFAIDRAKALAPQHPEWKTTQPFKAILENDMKAFAASGEKGLMQMMMATHAGMTTAEFEQIVTDWINTTRHPITGKLYKEMVFQPMLELLDYLRTNGFKTYIVSGGGVEFMRPWTEEVYGIPPEQVIGSSIKTRFELREGEPALVRLPEIDFIDDKDGKPVGIHKYIGKRPVVACGNSDGDLQMLQWTAAGEGKRLMLLVHHTDAEREWVYDRESHIGKLDKALDEAIARGWIVVDMKNDWTTIYP